MSDRMETPASMGTRRFGRVNWLGFYTLIWREIRRFTEVWTQTILAPLMTSALFMAIFAVAIGPSRGDVMGVPFVQFLAPGILAMTVIQNAFVNTSSSLMVSKVQGNIVDTLMPPLSPLELVIGFIAGGLARGLVVGVVIWAALALALGITVAHPLIALLFVALGAIFIGGLGILAGILANKFDQMAAITNFIITPLSFLSGTFYSVQALPPAVQGVIHYNPVFYLIDGVRYGFIGQSDSAPALGLLVLGVSCLLVTGLCWYWFRIGYRLKS